MNQPLFASRQGPLPISSFVLKSDGDRSSGAITISGVRTGVWFTKMVITAFGKSLEVSDEQLKEINSSITATVSNIGIGFENGYTESGGRVIYVNFGTGDPSISLKLCCVIFYENGSIAIKKVKTKND